MEREEDQVATWWLGLLGGCWNTGMARNMKDPLGRYSVPWAKANYLELLEELRETRSLEPPLPHTHGVATARGSACAPSDAARDWLLWGPMRCRDSPSSPNKTMQGVIFNQWDLEYPARLAPPSVPPGAVPGTLHTLPAAIEAGSAEHTLWPVKSLLA